jgi:hypothetical protein
MSAATAAPLQFGDEAVHLGIDDRLQPALAALGRVVEDEHVAGTERHVTALHRRQAVGPVLVRVLLAADPEEAAVEQPHRSGEDTVAARLVIAEAARRDLAQPRQGSRELEHLVELLLVTAGTPAIVVPVLFPSAGVGSDRLDVAVLVRTDPDVGPGGRDHQRGDPRQRLLVVDPPAGLLVEVRESAAAPEAANSRRGTVGATQSRHAASVPERPARET